MAEKQKRWAGLSRTAQRIANTLGIISADDVTGAKKWRSDWLELLDSYYEARQYTHKQDWLQALANDNSYVPIRSRKPLVNYNFAQVLTSRVAAMMMGERTFPSFVVEDDPDTSEFLRLVIQKAQLRANVIEPIRRMCNSGAVLIRYKYTEGALSLEHFLSKYCFPEFDERGQLSFVRVQYVFEDPHEKDAKGKPVNKWYRIDLGSMNETLYDNPVFKPGTEPVFTPVDTVEHGLGFVQAEWFRTHKDKHSPDGYSLIEDVLEFIDELNYSLSQSCESSSYNQNPQLAISGMDTDEIDALIASSTKAWNLGRDGKAAFIEGNMKGVETAIVLRDKLRLGIQDSARVVMMDPEKIVGHAQSGRAMEVLHAPLLDLVGELRPLVEENLINLILKICITELILNRQGVDTGLEMPPGWTPASLNITCHWPEIFPQTMEDLQKKVQVGTTAAAANVISRETVTRWLAKDFGVKDIDEELAKIAAQPVINPFGAF